MNINDIEKGFLETVREARPEDCKRIADTLRADVFTMDGYKDAAGNMTPLGELVAALIKVLKVNYGAMVETA